MDNGIIKTFTDVIRAATATKTAPYDTTAKVLRVEGSTAWVHIPGGVPETPVRLTISAKPGDAVQVRVSGGSAWLTGNDSAPPTDDAAADQVRADLEEAKTAIFRALEVISLQTRRLKIVDADGNVLAEFDADERLAEIAGWSAESGVLATVVDDPDIPTVQRRIALNAQSGEIVVQKIEKGSGLIEGDLIITKDKISFGIYNGGVLWYRNEVYMAADGQRGTFVFDSGAPYGGQIGICNYDNAGNDLYSGMADITGIGDGTLTGAIKALVPDMSKSSGSTTAVASGTNTTVASVTLRKGRYMLVGVGTFPAGSGRCNLHFSMAGNSGEADKYASVAVPLGNGVIRPQVAWTTTIANDGTTVYLVAYHTSGTTVNVTNTGVQVVPLDGGGIYAAG
jgi:hypothetical protein